ncbi:MAG: DNA polymerase I [Trueperaceae bacterium]|nr:MAG: DNA polymerase I [Trueperaceae bacterium]
MSRAPRDPTGQPTLFSEETSSLPTSQHKVVVIDGHALAYRSYYAIRDLVSSKGVSTNAVYGFVRTLTRILKEEGKHDATIVTFDAPAKTFRHEQYEDYKAGRAPTPEDLPGQIDIIKHFLDLLGLFRLEVPGLEADDLFGTIAKRCEGMGYQVEIITSDRDAFQLISERVRVRGLDKRDMIGPQEVFEKYGVTVEQWTDYRALTGDSSDNIPGARGIGPVSAKKLLQRYGDLDYILAHLDEVEPAGIAKKIRDSLTDVEISRELSIIVTDADIEVTPETWSRRDADDAGLRELLTELEFGSVLRELNLSRASDYRHVPWEERPIEGRIGFVLSGPRTMDAELIDLAIARDGNVSSAPDIDEGLALLKTARHVSACDAKALAVLGAKHDVDLTPEDDPLLMAYVLDPNTTQAAAVARRYGASEWGEDAASRAQVTDELLQILPGKLTDTQRALYQNIERPLQAVLAEMEIQGITVDEGLLRSQSEDLADQLDQIETRVRDIAEDPELNLNSRDQLASLLFDKLGLQTGRKTSTGKRSTAVSTLEPLKGDHEVVQLILDYRELAKLKSTYLDPLPKLIHPITGRVHTTFNQAVVATGRLSSTHPNLQNIPVRTELGRQIRKAFVAGRGNALLVADYSQIELRVLAHIAGEEALINAFHAGEDIHRRTAAEVHGVGMSEVTPEMRRVAKIINFGVLYGMSAHRLTRELGIDYVEAEAFINTYFERYPNVRHYIDSTLDSCRETGYVETLLGRRRLIPDIQAKNRNAREYAERTAYNMPIQGTAADIMKLAMISLAPQLGQFDGHLLLQVHDELIVEAPDAACADIAPLIRKTMEEAFELKVPLVADVGIGANWLEAK